MNSSVVRSWIKVTQFLQMTQILPYAGWDFADSVQ